MPFTEASQVCLEQEPTGREEAVHSQRCKELHCILESLADAPLTLDEQMLDSEFACETTIFIKIGTDASVSCRTTFKPRRHPSSS